MRRVGTKAEGLSIKQMLNRRVVMATTFLGLPWRHYWGCVGEGWPQEPPLRQLLCLPVLLPWRQ